MAAALLIIATAVALWLLADWLSSREAAAEPVGRRLSDPGVPILGPAERVGDFRLQPEMAYHPGHSWALALGPDRVRVGVDEFAVALLGPPDGVELPALGAAVVQGHSGFALRRGTWRAPVLSPMTGRVVAVNSLAVVNPEVLAREPYGDGWLLEVAVEDVRGNTNNLLQGAAARRWYDDAGRRCRLLRRAARAAPATGAKPPQWWVAAVREFLRTEAGSAATPADGGGQDRWASTA